MANIYDSTYTFDIEKNLRNSDKKKLVLLTDDELITINLHCNEIKIEELKKFLKENYTLIKKTIKKNVVLDNLNNDYSFDQESLNCQVKILNKRTEIKKDKINMFKVKEYSINYGDIEYTYFLTPEVIKLVKSLFNHNYINLVDLYNYVLNCKGLDSKKRKTTTSPTDKIAFTRNKDLLFHCNTVETAMSDEQIKEIIIKIFDCFIIDSIERTPLSNNQINIDINSSVEDLLTLKGSLVLAKLNSEILSSDLVYTEENKINKELKLRR